MCVLGGEVISVTFHGLGMSDCGSGTTSGLRMSDWESGNETTSGLRMSDWGSGNETTSGLGMSDCESGNKTTWFGNE